MLLKFIQLQVGQAFLFEGQRYVKSSPLMGRAEATGQERFMPRSALVETGDGPAAAAAAAAPAGDLPAAEVMEAWRALRARMLGFAAELEGRGEAGLAADLRRELDEAGRDFERRLGMTQA